MPSEFFQSAPGVSLHCARSFVLNLKDFFQQPVVGSKKAQEMKDRMNQVFEKLAETSASLNDDYSALVEAAIVEAHQCQDDICRQLQIFLNTNEKRETAELDQYLFDSKSPKDTRKGDVDWVDVIAVYGQRLLNIAERENLRGCYEKVVCKETERCKISREYAIEIVHLRLSQEAKKQAHKTRCAKLENALEENTKYFLDLQAKFDQFLLSIGEASATATPALSLISLNG